MHVAGNFSARLPAAARQQRHRYLRACVCAVASAAALDPAAIFDMEIL